MSSIEKNVIQANFMPGGETDIFMTTTDMLIKIIELTDNKLTSKINTVVISRVMRQLEFPSTKMRINGLPIRGYWVRQKYNLHTESPLLPFNKPF